jgi:hypothetical protein
VLGSAVPRPVAVEVAKIPWLPWVDALSASSAGDVAGGDEGRELSAEPLVLAAIASRGGAPVAAVAGASAAVTNDDSTDETGAVHSRVSSSGTGEGESLADLEH